MKKLHSISLVLFTLLGIFYGTSVNAQLVLGPNCDDTAPLLTSSYLTYSSANGYYIADVSGGPGYCKIVPNSLPITIYIVENPQLIIHEYPDGPILDARAAEPGQPIVFVTLPDGIHTFILEFQTGNAKVGLSIDNVLPVELTTFNASAVNGKVAFNWQTATEVNNYGFEIQRSGTSASLSASWETLGFVQGHGNSNSPKNYSFVDNLAHAHDLNLDRISYRLKQIDFDGKYEYSDVVEVKVETPAQFKLAQNFPNPFNPETTISYQLPSASHVTLKVYDMLGREVTTLVDEEKEAGNYNVKFSVETLHATSLPSGVYLYKLQNGMFTQTKKLLLMK